MEVYSWEQSLADTISTWPRSGPLYDIMDFISYPGLTGWLLWIVLFCLVFRQRLVHTALPFICGIAAAALGDLASRRVVKAFILRPRPHFIHEICTDPKCWGFVSSHTTNIMAFVTLFCLLDRRNLIWGIPVVGAVSVSRLYLLDHYPLDVIGGLILGLLIGVGVWRIFLKVRELQWQT